MPLKFDTSSDFFHLENKNDNLIGIKDNECVLKREEHRATWKRGSRALDRISRFVLPMSYFILLLVFLLPPLGEVRL